MKSWTLILVAGSLVACTDPLVGDWEWKEGGATLDMSIESDGLGSAEFTNRLVSATGYATSGGMHFDVEWTEDGGDYRVELDCDSTSGVYSGMSCSGVEWDYECALGDDEDRLACNGTGPIEDLEFDRKN